MDPTHRNTSLPFVEIPGNGLGDFASEGGGPAPLLESPAQTEAQADPIDDTHDVVAHEPPPKRQPVRRLVFAIRRAALAVLFAPVLIVAWFVVHVWEVAHRSVTRSSRGVTSALGWLRSGLVVAALWMLDTIAAAIDFVIATVAATGRGIVHGVVAVWTAIVNAPLAVVTGIRDAVRAAFAAGVQGVLDAAVFVVGTAWRAIQATTSVVLGVCRGVLRLALGAVHVTTSSTAAAGRGVWRVITGIRDAVQATGAAGIALVTRACRIAAAPFIVAARAVGFMAGRSFRALVVTLTVTGFLVGRGLLFVLGGAAIVIGTVAGLVLVSVYGVRRLAATSVALVRAIGPASTRIGHAAAAGATVAGNGVARSVFASRSAVRTTARLVGPAAVRLAESARTTGGQITHAGATRGAAGLAAARAVSARAGHAVWVGTRATVTNAVREASEQTAALSQLARHSASRVKSRVHHESPVRVNFAALPGRAADVRVATTLAFVSMAGLLLMVGGLVLLVIPQTPGRSAPPPAGTSLHAVAVPPEPIVSVPSQPEAVAPRPPAPAAAATRPTAVPPATIEPEPAGRSTLSTARVRAIWNKTDTRSLDRAIAEMRSATLAFRRCEMRITSPDIATATCNESASPRVAWTFDFRRNDDRWRIEGVSTTRTPPVLR